MMLSKHVSHIAVALAFIIAISAITGALPLAEEGGLSEVDVCSMDKVVGPCEALITRYFYNKETKRCEQFNYGGCEGNGNNFETMEQCQETCSDKCSLPKEEGPCFGLFYKYFYNTVTSTCEQFVYGGCLGNENNFDTMDACKQTCSKHDIGGEGEGGEGEGGGSEESCGLAKDPGPCFGLFTRFYYNKYTKSCEEFTYGGCLGNTNNYKTIDECNNRCKN